MNINPDTVLQVLAIVGVPIGIYAAVRADLASLKVRMERAERDIQNLFGIKS